MRIIRFGKNSRILKNYIPWTNFRKVIEKEVRTGHCNYIEQGPYVVNPALFTDKSIKCKMYDY